MTVPKEKKENPIDWDEVHRRVEGAKEAMEKGWSPPESEKRRILKSRAKALAEVDGQAGPREQLEIVEFVLSREKYGLESSYVREVCPMREFTPLPCTPPFVLGIIHVRGEIYSVVDLRKFFDLPEQGLGGLNRVILLSSGGMGFGLLADAISTIRSVAVEEMAPPPATFAGLGREYLKGISPDGTAVLDAGKILSDERIVVNDFV